MGWWADERVRWGGKTILTRDDKQRLANTFVSVSRSGAILYGRCKPSSWLARHAHVVTERSVSIWDIHLR